MIKHVWNFLYLAILCLSCAEKKTAIENGDLVLTIDNNLHTLASSRAPGAKPFMKSPAAAEYLETKRFVAKDFALKDASVSELNDEAGSGKAHVFHGGYQNGEYQLAKILEIKTYDSLPGLAVTKTSYVNTGNRIIEVKAWVNNNYSILSHQDDPLFWSFQGSSSSERRDWILPLKPGFTQQNYMGMNDSDYGGGIPATVIWRADQGIAVGHAHTTPKLVSLPVDVDRYDANANISVRYDYTKPYLLAPGDTLETLETFVAMHSGDYFNALSLYGEALRAKGLQFAPPVEGAYESSWCAWGYMRDFTLDEIFGTLPKVKELGIRWATIDDGFQQAIGDWDVNLQKFPKGNDQMEALVDSIHALGLKAMIWWTPLAASPMSKLYRENPDVVLINDMGAPQYITWWDSYYMSPAYQKTIEHTREVLDLFLNQWGFDGIKMDGQHLNAVAPDHNPAHDLGRPEESVEKLPVFFKMIREEAMAINPDVVLQNCPCGTCMSVFNMPYMNQAVASDPLSSWQIRHKGKTYKALLGKTAYFGDHVELSDGRNDFASSFGIGAVLGTKFTWPRENPTVEEDNLLTPKKEETWRKWFDLYHRKMLSKETYLGDLYDIGYDKPETHVVLKGDTLHYAFYADSWNGAIHLRGLNEERRYRVYDYENERDLGTVSGADPVFQTSFDRHLLIEVYPAD